MRSYTGHALGHLIADGPCLMGIVNVTPDSFSDGGHFSCVDKAIEHGLALVREGARILDIGGESTRPGAQPVDPEEEIRRIVPVIEGLRGAACLSVDTRHAATMEAALKAGISAINDISALTHDMRSIEVAKDAQVPVFLMHMQGTPQTMQANPCYNNVIGDVFDFLSRQITRCEAAGIERKRLVADPGIGFGKTLDDNLSIIRNIDKFHDLDTPILLGVSRKSFIAKISEDEPPMNRLSGSLSAALWGLQSGVQFFRVHDVAETRQAFAVWKGITSMTDRASHPDGKARDCAA